MLSYEAWQGTRLTELMISMYESGRHQATIGVMFVDLSYTIVGILCFPELIFHFSHDSRYPCPYHIAQGGISSDVDIL